MASTPSSSSLHSSRGFGATPQSTPKTSKATDLRSRRSSAFEFGTPLNFESTSPFRTPNSTKKASLLSKTPFGSSNRSSATTTTSTAATPQPTNTPSQPPKPLTESAKLTARFRSLWLGESHATTALLQAKSMLPYSGFAKLMLQTNLDRLYIFSFLCIHVFLSGSLFAPLHPLSSLVLAIRPTLALLSLVAFSLSILPLIYLHKAGIAESKQIVNAKRGTGQDVSIGGVSLPFGSPAAHYYAAIRQAKTGLSIGVYALSGFFLAASHVVGLMLYSSDSSTWAPYQSISFRNAQGLRISSLRPNERLFFLLGSNLIMGAVYTLYRALSLSSALSDAPSPFSAPIFDPQATVESLATRLSNRFRRRLPKAVLAGSILPSVLLVSYFAIRRPLFRMILSVIGHNSALRPLLIPSFRLNFLNAELVFRTTALGIFSTLTWETINIFWEVFFTQPFVDLRGGLSRFAREPTKCLIEGLQSRTRPNVNETEMGPLERGYYSHFAFAEMAIIAATDVDRRRAIFREVGRANANSMEGGTKSAWVLVAQECLKVLEEERLYLTNKGRPANAGNASAATQSGTSHLKALDSDHKVLLESGAAVTRKGAATIWDRLASPGVSAPATTPAVAPAKTTSPANASDGLDSIFHRLAPPPETKHVAKSTAPATLPPKQVNKTTSAVVISLLFAISNSLSKGVIFFIPADLQHVLLRLPFIRSIPSLKHYLFTPSNQATLYIGNLPHDAATTTWSIQILSALLSASIEQDEYGTVALSSAQKVGVDEVLDEIASLLLVLSQWGQEIATEMQGESESRKQELTLLWDRRVAPIVIASRTALSLVLGVFEPTGFRLRAGVQEKVDKALAAG